MGMLFSGSELVNIAIGIERNGIAYYESLAKSTTDTLLKDTYSHLANMERKHMETFQKMLDSVGKYQPTYAGETEEEYELYLRALIDSVVFPDDKAAKEMANKASSEAEALHIGIIAEKDSILFYSEMRNLVRELDCHIIDAIVGEEKAHLRQLSQLKAKLQKA